jgi:hypothetical protein
MKSYKGRFQPLFPNKYKGDPTNIIFRSLWELKVMRSLDENANVIEWSSEEMFVPYLDPLTNRRRRYFPDFIAKIRTPDGTIRTTMIEVKPKKQTIEPKVKERKTKSYINEVVTFANNRAKWTYAQAYCLDRGWDFKILTEEDIFGKKSHK